MILTEIKRIRFNDSCVSNPVFLSWINSFGGFNYWLFQRNQIKNVETGEEVIFEPAQMDLETSDSFEEVLSLSSREVWVLGVQNIDKNDVELIKGMLQSPRVQWLMNPDTWQAEGAKWVTVKVQRGSFKLYETLTGVGDIIINITFPEKQIQNQ
jgi:hypothetical protein